MHSICHLSYFSYFGCTGRHKRNKDRDKIYSCIQHVIFSCLGIAIGMTNCCSSHIIDDIAHIPNCFPYPAVFVNSANGIVSAVCIVVSIIIILCQRVWCGEARCCRIILACSEVVPPKVTCSIKFFSVVQFILNTPACTYIGDDSSERIVVGLLYFRDYSLAVLCDNASYIS